MESGLQSFTEMLTVDSKRSLPLKLNESEWQVVSQNVFAVLALLLQAVKERAAARSINIGFIKISWNKNKGWVFPFKILLSSALPKLHYTTCSIDFLYNYLLQKNIFNKKEFFLSSNNIDG